MTVYAWRCLAFAFIVVAISFLHATGLKVRMPVNLAEWRAVVGVWCGAVVVSGFALTAVARVFGGNEATISASLQEWSKLWPVIPATVFFIAGHIWFPVWSR